MEAKAEGWRLSCPSLDVTSDASVNAAVTEVLEQTQGRLDVLVNNAGYFCVGPVEETHPDELRAQLETNLVGVLRVTRAVLPAMRARRQGRIINVSSLAARAVLPMLGAYHASKAGLEALTESLHYEMAPFGIRVSSILPGPFATQLHVNEKRVAASSAPESPYVQLTQQFQKLNQRAPRGDLRKVVAAIERAATTRRPKLRYMVGPLSWTTRFAHPLAPQWLYGWLVKQVFGLGRLGPPDAG